MKELLGLLFSVLLVAVFTLGTSEVARAQQATGRIIGNVSDPSGAGIPGVQVKATNVATRVSQETKTDREGFFEILSLPIGTYDVRVMAAGFREQVFEHQVLQIAQSLRVDAKLVIGEQSDVVEVTTQTANIETQSETVGGTVVGEAIQQAPLNGRNVLDLAKLQPGVTETNGDSSKDSLHLSVQLEPAARSRKEHSYRSKLRGKQFARAYVLAGHQSIHSGHDKPSLEFRVG